MRTSRKTLMISQFDSNVNVMARVLRPSNSAVSTSLIWPWVFFYFQVRASMKIHCYALVLAWDWQLIGELVLETRAANVCLLDENPSTKDWPTEQSKLCKLNIILVSFGERVGCSEATPTVHAIARVDIVALCIAMSATSTGSRH